MISTWRFVFGLAWALTVVGVLVHSQEDLELDYSNEYDNVRPNLVYPDQPRLDKRLSAAAEEFGEGIRNAWQSMVDSFRSYFDELRTIFSDGIEDNVETFPVSS